MSLWLVRLIKLDRPPDWGVIVSTACIATSGMLLVAMGLREIAPYVPDWRPGWLWLMPEIPMNPMALFVSTALIAPVGEEIAFRGLLQTALEKTPLGFIGAAILTTLGWTALHIHLPAYAVLTTLIWGGVLSYILWRTGSLWTCILAHGMFNLIPALSVLIFSR